MSYSEEEIKKAGLDDFRFFLKLVWDYLGLPPPTPVQYDIAYNLQHAPRLYPLGRRFIVQAFRGVGKSWITVAFVLWLLFINPQLKILVVSANQKLADNFSQFCKQLINGMPLLQHLKPREGQKDSAIEFDVGPATPSKDPSVKSAGITGQITGSRADVIVPDDIEIPKNSFTHNLRERLAELVKEFDAILKPGGRVIYLGTPQAEQSIYMKLLKRGYMSMVWTIEIPSKVELYAGRLANFITRRIEKGSKPHDPVEPDRFPREEIDERMLSYGVGGFALQYMLDTNPSESDKNPLKTRNLIIHDCDRDMGHVKMVWGSSPELTIQDLASGGFDGDCYFRPAWKSDEMVPYQGTVMAIDPSGRGNDETAYSVTSYLNGMIVLRALGGYKDGFHPDTLRALATKMVTYRVNYWWSEENYGGGMFNQLLKPVVAAVFEEARVKAAEQDKAKIKMAGFDDEYDGWVNTQKEMRILDTLQPVIEQHRLVVDRRVIEEDLVQQAEYERFSFIQQLTRMSRIKGCLPNEDRLEAVSMGVGYWTERMSRDVNKALVQHKANVLDKELKKFHKNAISIGLRARGKGRPSRSWRKGER